VTIVEIAVAVITTGPAYVTVWWAIRKDARGQVPACSSCARCTSCEQRGMSGAQTSSELYELAA
jgi:hypothetical protein